MSLGFFKKLGSEHGVLMEVANRTETRSRLRKAWIKVDMWDAGLIPAVMEVDSRRVRFGLGLRCLELQARRCGQLRRNCFHRPTAALAHHGALRLSWKMTRVGTPMKLIP